jgi:glycosyltransferase involved in cell wall biosynthesis
MPFAGVAWQVLQYLEGFRRLGHEVFYLEETLEWPADPVAKTPCEDGGAVAEYVASLMARCGLNQAWCYRDVASGGLYGCSERELEQTLAAADVLINLGGITALREEHVRIPVRVYLETDPVAPQLEVAKGYRFTIELLAAHTHHLTYGENFGAPDCGVPLGRFDYWPTQPPVVLDWWDPHDGPDSNAGGLLVGPHERPFTTIANWRQRGKDIVWRGRLLTWSKDLQFMPYLALAHRVRAPIELALAGANEETVSLLRAAGWRVRPAGPLSNDLDAYRDFIRSSAGEFSVAKEQYEALRSGWFSDRSACYLAAGRPVIVQDTGFGRVLPTGEGVLPFSDIAEAVAAFESVLAEYDRHCRAARAIAHEYLRAEKVLGALLDYVSVPERTRAPSGLLA